MYHYTHVLRTPSVWSPFVAPCELAPESVDHDKLLSLLASFPVQRGMKLARSQGASIHPVHADFFEIFWTLHEEDQGNCLTHQNGPEADSPYEKTRHYQERTHLSAERCQQVHRPVHAVRSQVRARLVLGFDSEQLQAEAVVAVVGSVVVMVPEKHFLDMTHGRTILPYDH